MVLIELFFNKAPFLNSVCPVAPAIIKRRWKVFFMRTFNLRIATEIIYICIYTYVWEKFNNWSIWVIWVTDALKAITECDN